MAVAAILKPIAMAKTRNITDSVRPIVATAFTLTCDTKNMSTMANNDSITISRIIGTESMNIARLIEPVVKLFSLPETAILRLLKMDFMDLPDFNI